MDGCFDRSEQTLSAMEEIGRNMPGAHPSGPVEPGACLSPRKT